MSTIRPFTVAYPVLSSSCKKQATDSHDAKIISWFLGVACYWRTVNGLIRSGISFIGLTMYATCA